MMELEADTKASHDGAPVEWDGKYVKVNPVTALTCGFHAMPTCSAGKMGLVLQVLFAGFGVGKAYMAGNLDPAAEVYHKKHGWIPAAAALKRSFLYELAVSVALLLFFSSPWLIYFYVGGVITAAIFVLSVALCWCVPLLGGGLLFALWWVIAVGGGYLFIIGAATLHLAVSLAAGIDFFKASSAAQSGNGLTKEETMTACLPVAKDTDPEEKNAAIDEEAQASPTDLAPVEASPDGNAESNTI